MSLFFHGIYNEIERKKQFLSEGQILLIKEFDTPPPGWINQLESKLDYKNSKLRKKFSDNNIKTIAIYSLTESASKRASEVIRKINSDIKVKIFSGKVEDDSLVNSAKYDDIFVVVTLSAKHAATKALKHRPKDKPLLYAKGKGSSSIIFQLENEPF